MKKLQIHLLVFEFYLRTISERFNALCKRLAGVPPQEWYPNYPWMFDYRITNIHREADRISQYLIRDVIKVGEKLNLSHNDIFLRVITYRIFNRDDLWKKLENQFGVITCSNFPKKEISKFLSDLLNKKELIFNPAYIVCTTLIQKGTLKHDFYLDLIESLMTDHAPDKIIAAKSINEIYRYLKSFLGIGPFLAVQFTEDLLYTTLANYQENTFMPEELGKGSVRGLKKLFPNIGNDFHDGVKWLLENLDRGFAKYGLQPPKLCGFWPMKISSVLSVLCEGDKLCRVGFKDVDFKIWRAPVKIKQGYGLDKIKPIRPIVLPDKYYREYGLPVPQENNN